MDRLDQAWQSEELARTFNADVRAAIPLAEAQLELLVRLVRQGRSRVSRVLDLGCGDGIVARRLLAEWPAARLCLLDFSPPMLQAAREALGDDAGRHHLVLADLAEGDWAVATAALAPYDVVVSGFAIHHQPDETKQAIYQAVYDVLAPGGLFCHLEHVASACEWHREVFDEAFIDSLWAVHRERDGGIDRAAVAEAFYHRADKAANILAPVADQLAWLRQIGFVEVDCWFRYLELALFGGRRPG